MTPLTKARSLDSQATIAPEVRCDAPEIPLSCQGVGLCLDEQYP